ncbi:MAG: extracellular solute-binding protein [Butyrivibrio sp.]|nr:extracellular solute-binding protein [Butyrivibrio sp.]
MSKFKLLIGITLAIIFFGIALIFINTKRVNSREEKTRLVVVSPHPTEFIIPLVQEFENETGIAVEVRSSGTSAAISEIIAGDDIDVLWGGSILSVGPYKDYFYPYNTLNKAVFTEDCKGVSDEFTCFSDVPSIIMVNKDIIGDIEVNGYEDLLNDKLKGKIAFASPDKSSSSFEHLVNMLYAMGNGDPEDGWDYVKELSEQLDGNILESSSEVYNGVANGKYKVGLTFEEAAVTMLKNDKHISIIYMNEGVVATPDGIYIDKNTKHLEEAKRFVDFFTSKDAQNYMAKNLGRRSVRKDVDPSSMVISYDDINRIKVDRENVVNNKDEWINHFLQIYEEENHE